MIRMVEKLAAGTVCAALMATVALPASAQSMQELRQQLETLQRQFEDLERQQQETAREAREAKEKTDAIDDSLSNVVFEWAPGPTIRTKDGRFSFHVRGRVQTDYNYISASNGDVDTNTMELRRARLGIEGVAWHDVQYKFEVDFADDDVSVTDAFVAFKQIKPVTLTIGQFKTPNSMEEQTSSRYITFMERAQFTDAFALNRRLGAGADVNGPNWSVATGVFFQNTGDEDDAGPFKNTFGAVAARAHYAIPFGTEGQHSVHLGTSVRYRNCDNDLNSQDACGGDRVRFRQRPFFHGTDNRTVNTGTIDNVTSDIFWGPELALVRGPLAIKGEGGLLWGSRDSDVPGDDTRNFGAVWGAFADVAYFLTGENQPYSKGSGTFGRPRVNNPVFQGGWGAWELAARFDYLSLNDSDNGIQGGEQWVVVAGVNWWLNRHTRVMFNYAHTEVNQAGTPTDNRNFGVDGFGIRAQVDW